MFLSPPTCLAALLALGAGVQEPRPFGLPSLARVAFAPERPRALDDGVREELIELLEKELRPGTRVVWLDAWDEEGRAAAEAEDVGFAIIVESSGAKPTKPVTRRYVDGKGQKTRVRFTGAASEVRLGLLRRSGGWSRVGGLGAEETAQPPWILMGELGRYENEEVDPDVHLAKLVAREIGRGIAFLACEALWSRRSALRDGDDDPDALDAQLALWEMGALAVSDREITAPRASLALAAARAWEDLDRRYRSGRAAGGDRTCGWCGAGDLDRCECGEARLLQTLIETSHGLFVSLIPYHPDPLAKTLASGLRGERPAVAFGRRSQLVQALRELPDRTLATAWEYFQTSRYPREMRLHVVVGVEEPWPELVLDLDPDYAQPALQLMSRLTSTSPALQKYGILQRLPFAGLLERDPDDRSKGVVRDVVRRSDVDTGHIQGLLEQAKWGEFGG